MGEEISGRYSLRLLMRDVSLSDEEEAAESEWPLTRLIIFLAADETKKTENKPLKTQIEMHIISLNDGRTTQSPT